VEAVRSFSGTSLVEWRRERSLSHDDLASLVGISRPNLIAYEKGRRRPSPKTIALLAKALGITASRLSAIPEQEWNLADLRAFSGKTKAAAANALGVARATYDAMESGRRRLRPSLVDPLAAALGCARERVLECHGRTLAGSSAGRDETPGKAPGVS
jgi:transcriptional regulator with XRE-family HTH domain